MKEPRHIIGRQILSLKGVKEGDAHNMQNAFAKIYQEKLLPIIDRYLTAFSPGQELHRLDSLTLDLGQIPAEGLTEKTIANLELELAKHFSVKAPPTDSSKAEQVQNENETHLELLSYFLATGHLPWWAKDKSRNPIAGGIAFLIQNEPQLLLAKMYDWTRDTNYLKRLVRQLSLPQWIPIASLQLGIDTDELKEALNKIVHKLSPSPVKPSSRILNEIAEKFLSWTFLSRPDDQDRITFWKGFLLQLAASSRGQSVEGIQPNKEEYLQDLLEELAKDTKGKPTSLEQKNTSSSQSRLHVSSTLAQAIVSIDSLSAYLKQLLAVRRKHRETFTERKNKLIKIREEIQNKQIPFQERAESFISQLQELSNIPVNTFAQIFNEIGRLPEILYSSINKDTLNQEEISILAYYIFQLPQGGLTTRDMLEVISILRSQHSMEEESRRKTDTPTIPTSFHLLFEESKHDQDNALIKAATLASNLSGIGKTILASDGISSEEKQKIEVYFQNIREASISQLEIQDIGRQLLAKLSHSDEGVISLEAALRITQHAQDTSPPLEDNVIVEIGARLKGLLSNSSFSQQELDFIQQFLREVQLGKITEKDIAHFISTLSAIRRRINEIQETASRKQPSKSTDRNISDLDSIYINNAGLVILWPFLERFFSNMNWLSNKAFQKQADQHRAVGVLQYVVNGQSNPLEYQCGLNKLLCGMAQEEVLDFGDAVTPAEASVAEELLTAVIANAPILRNMTLEGFRGSFLLRDGVLKNEEGLWQLHVEKASYDIILSKFPWSWNMVKLPWMDLPLQVDWIN